MMSDRQFQVSLTTALAWFFWSIVVACITGSYIDRDWWLAATGCAASGAAATLHIRSFFSTFGVRMQAAFDLGREIEREKQQQSSLRTVR